MCLLWLGWVLVAAYGLPVVAEHRFLTVVAPVAVGNGL